MELVLGADEPHQQERRADIGQAQEDFEMVAFTRNRRKILECYGNWITCSCRCGRKWNFANGFEGLRRDDGKVAGCKVENWMNAAKKKWQPQWGAGRGEKLAQNCLRRIE